MSNSKNLKLVPASMLLDKETIGAINFHCGDGGDNFGEHSDGLLWIGTVTDDDGKEVYGLHLATAEYPEEGSTTLVEFEAAEDAAQSELSALREELAGLKETVALFESEYSKQSESLTAAEQRNGTLSNALIKIIEMNRQQANDQYGDAEKAESWSCITVAREALGARNADD